MSACIGMEQRRSWDLLIASVSGVRQPIEIMRSCIEITCLWGKKTSETQIGEIKEMLMIASCQKVINEIRPSLGRVEVKSSQV